MEYLLLTLKSIFFAIIISLIYKLFSKNTNTNLKNIDLIIILFLLNISIYGIFSNLDIGYFIIVITIITLIRMLYFVIIKRLNKNKVLDEEKVIISHGKLNFKELLKTDFNLNQLLLELKRKKIKSIEEVELAFLNNNELIIFKRNSNLLYPIPIIVDGIIFEDTLKQIKKDREWLYENLNDQKISVNNIVYGFYKNNQIYLIKKEN